MIKPILSIIILSYNTKGVLEDCLTSIVRHDKRLNFSGKSLRADQEEIIPAEIIVVDNGSTDGSREMINDQWPMVKLIVNKNNLGFGKANNQGMRKARGEYFLLLNSDTLLEEGAISQVVFWLSSRSEFDLVGCKLLNLDKTSQPSTGRFPNLINSFSMLFLDHLLKKQLIMDSPKEIKKVDWIMGACMFLRKDVFRQTKGFDEKIFMYMEEVEWCYRIKQAGFEVGFYPNAKIIHLGGASSTSGRTAPIINIFKGLIYFYKKHYSKTSLFILKLMLKLKAGSSWLLGIISGNEYLKKTYHQAWEIT